jgi:hypothetical protein
VTVGLLAVTVSGTAVMLKALLVPDVRPVLVADRVYPVLTLFIDRLLKVAMPPEAGTVVVPVSAPPLGLVPMAIVIEAVLVVTRLPNWSSTWTVTAGEMELPYGVLLGCCVNTSLLAAPAVTVTVGCIAMFLSVPPLCFVCVVNVYGPVVVGAVALAYLSVKLDPPEIPRQVILTVMIEPATEGALTEAQVPGDVETLLVCGAVQPTGTVRVSWEPLLKSFPWSVVNVKVRVMPVLPATTVGGATVMVPSPLLAFPAATYTAVPAGVAVAPTVAVGSGDTAAPNALATLMRPKGAPETGSTAPMIWFEA